MNHEAKVYKLQIHNANIPQFSLGPLAAAVVGFFFITNGRIQSGQAKKATRLAYKSPSISSLTFSLLIYYYDLYFL